MLHLTALLIMIAFIIIKAKCHLLTDHLKDKTFNDGLLRRLALPTKFPNLKGFFRRRFTKISNTFIIVF